MQVCEGELFLLDGQGPFFKLFMYLVLIYLAFTLKFCLTCFILNLDVFLIVLFLIIGKVH